jgi:hypothetical protein
MDTFLKDFEQDNGLQYSHLLVIELFRDNIGYQINYVELKK